MAQTIKPSEERLETARNAAIDRLGYGDMESFTAVFDVEYKDYRAFAFSTGESLSFWAERAPVFAREAVNGETYSWIRSIEITVEDGKVTVLNADDLRHEDADEGIDLGRSEKEYDLGNLPPAIAGTLDDCVEMFEIVTEQTYNATRSG